MNVTKITVEHHQPNTYVITAYNGKQQLHQFEITPYTATKLHDKIIMENTKNELGRLAKEIVYQVKQLTYISRPKNEA